MTAWPPADASLTRTPAGHELVLGVQGGLAARCTVLHASGVLADALLAKQTAPDIRAIFSSKVPVVRACHAAVDSCRSCRLQAAPLRACAGGWRAVAVAGHEMRADAAHGVLLFGVSHAGQRGPGRICGRQRRLELHSCRVTVTGEHGIMLQGAQALAASAPETPHSVGACMSYCSAPTCHESHIPCRGPQPWQSAGAHGLAAAWLLGVRCCFSAWAAKARAAKQLTAFIWTNTAHA